MVTGAEGLESQSKQPNLEEQQKQGEAKNAATKLLTETHSDTKEGAATKPPAQADAKKSDGAKDLPSISLVSPKVFTPYPWEQPAPENGRKPHMDYGRHKDTIVHPGEGPFHVAERLLGKGAKDGDVRALSDAMSAQFKEEAKDDKALESLRAGARIVREDNIGQILNRIADPACRERISERLKEGWTDKEQPAAIPFDHDAREGETQPSFIEDDKQFLKDLSAAATDVKAAEYRSRGQCAAGARLAFNELPNWRIDGGTVDKSINKDPNGWRGGIKLATDLASTGLFEQVPLSKIGIDNLKEGYILGRVHYPDYVKAHPTWEGEDFGDIDIVTKKHKPQDDGKLYHDSFVLIPKKHKP
jgi:hypothetical protein